MKLLKKIKALINYNLAIAKAKRLREETGVKQYVLSGEDGRLLVMTKNHFYKLRKRGVIDKSYKPRNLNSIAVWYTDGKDSRQMCNATAKKRKDKYINICTCL